MSEQSRLLEAFAKIVTRLQVPMSMGSPAVVPFRDDWGRVRNILGIFGWEGEDEVLAKLREKFPDVDFDGGVE